MRDDIWISRLIEGGKGGGGEDDEMDVEIDEEEHLAPAYLVVVALPATAPSAEETEPFETDESAATPPPHPAYRMTARISIPEPLPVPAWSDSELLVQIPIRWGYRAARIRMRAEAAATSHSLPLPPPFILSPTRPDAPPPLPTSAPTSFPPLLLPSDQSSAAAAARPARVLGQITALLPLWTDDPDVTQRDSHDMGLRIHGRRWRDTDEIYTRLDDEQTRDSYWPVGSICYLETDVDMHIHVSSWRLRLGCLERLGDERWMLAILLMEGLFPYAPQFMHRCQRSQSYSQDTGDRERFSDLLEIDRRRREEMRELRACLSQNLDSSSLFDLDCYADTTERRRSTSGTGHHTAGAGDSLTGTGDCISRGRLLPTWTTGTAGGPAPPKRGAARGGW
ncbi:hypothetical protein Tco_0951068 [Tanacetum coccineum]|uniref:Uncharacterized protein n=1 Tax=Tanacetum coccineum TaxID=301880 RepID=A0ABQ5DTY2_9ASTR